MPIPVPLRVRKADYSLTLAQEAGWNEVVETLTEIFSEHDALNSNKNSDTVLYVYFEFMDFLPKTIGIYTEPPSEIFSLSANDRSRIFSDVRYFICPTLEANPAHFAMFRYTEHWQVARLFDRSKEHYNEWRALRSKNKSDRRDWFQKLAKTDFEYLLEMNLFITIDPKTTLQEVIPLLIGVDKDTVWMMTSFFSDRLSPRSGSNWAKLPTCDAEVLYRCSRKQLGTAVTSVSEIQKTQELIAVEQVVEGFYWRFFDKLETRSGALATDFSEPQRLNTTSKQSRRKLALKAETPFLISSYDKSGKIVLTDGRQVSAMLVTIESTLTPKLSPNVTTKVKKVTGDLGKTPKKFKKPTNKKLDLYTAVRQEIEEHGSIRTKKLKERLESFARLEFYFDRYLPDDLAPHLECLPLYEFSIDNATEDLARTRRSKEYVPERHDMTLLNIPSLEKISVYKGLKEIDLRQSKIGDLEWLESVSWLQKLSIGGSDVLDFTPLASMTNLKSLDLHQTKLKDLSVISSLTNLEELKLSSVQIEDISPLSSLTNLKKLSLGDMPVKDISSLASLKNLEELILNGTRISDFSTAGELPALKLLGIAETEIDDLSVLPEMPKLETLYIWNCMYVKDLSPLDRYPKLKPVNTNGTGVDI